VGLIDHLNKLHEQVGWVSLRQAADAITALQARIAELEAFVRRVGDGYHAAKDASRILDEFTTEARALAKGEP
jgi:hypothetical protein